MKITIPKDFPVRPLKRNQPAEDRATCGTCGLSWDDAIPTPMTPAPAARCPFEEVHDYAPPKLTRKQERENADRRNRAFTMLAQYSELVGQEEESLATNLGDLLADLLHLVGGKTFDKCTSTARTHYEAERNGEP